MQINTASIVTAFIQTVQRIANHTWLHQHFLNNISTLEYPVNTGHLKMAWAMWHNLVQAMVV